MCKFFSVYKITNNVNGKCYVGFTSQNVNSRWKQHLRQAKNKTYNSILHKAIRKYGKNNFTVVTLFESTNKNFTLNVIEPLLIDFYNCEYNSTNGGEGCHGRKLSEEAKRKISEARAGYKVPEQIKKRWSIQRKKNKTFSGENNPNIKNRKTYEIKFKSGETKIIVGIRKFVKDTKYHRVELRKLLRNEIDCYKDIVSIKEV